MRSALLLFLILALLYLATLGGHLYSPDEEILFRTTESLALRGSLAVEPLMGFATRTGLDGRDYAQYGIGQPIAAVPFYWLGRALGEIVGSDAAWVALGREMRAEYVLAMENEPDNAVGPGVAARFGLSLFNLLITALSGSVLFLLLRRLTASTRAAWLAALAWGAGSVAWPHARTFFTESFAGLCLLVSLWLLSRLFNGHPARRPRLTLLLAGLAAGYGCLVRLDSIVFLPGLAMIVVWGDFVRRADATDHRWLVTDLARHAFRRGPLMRLWLYALPVAMAGGVILGLNARHFGSIFASAYADQPEGITFSTPILAGLYGFLMSVGKGLFFFSPALVLSCWGWGAMLRRRTAFGLGILVLFLSFLIFQSSWRNWPGGWCWGPRHIIQIHALLAVPLAFWLAERWNPVRRIAFTCALLVGAGVQVFGCSQNFIEYYRIFFIDPAPPRAQLLYDMSVRPDLARFMLLERMPSGEMRPVPLTALPAPINDSIYIVQNSQWVRYREMWTRLGLHDFFWLHLRNTGFGDS